VAGWVGEDPDRLPPPGSRNARSLSLIDVIVHELSRTDARRVAVRAQLLDSTRPSDLADTVRRLTLLQNDLTAAVAPSAELVTWSRLGSSCPRNAVTDAVDEQSLIDLHGMLRPAEDLVLYRAEMAEWPGVDEVPYWLEGQAGWVRANDGFRRDLLDELMRDGPLTRRELPDTCTVPWRSSGWNNNRNVAMMLEMLVLRGEVAVAGRRGRDRVWDLASRIYPDDEVVPTAQAHRIRDERRLGVGHGAHRGEPSDGGRVRVVSRRGSVEAPVRYDGTLRPGLAFMNLHFPDEVATNILTIDATDPKSGTAEFKATAIRVEAV